MRTVREAAAASGLPPKTVRYYAEIGLAPPAGRTEAGYRVYDEPAVQRLCFVRRARAFGFSIEQCRELLGLYEDRERESAQVKRIAEERLTEIDAKLRDLALLREELAALVSACRGDGRPDCPILERFERASRAPQGSETPD